MTPQEIMYLTNPLRGIVSKLGDKWSLLILYQLSNKAAMRFGQISSDMIDISEKELSKKLKVLVNDGLIEKQVLYSFPMGTNYTLTDRGRELMNIVKQLMDWAIRHFHYDDFWVETDSEI